MLSALLPGEEGPLASEGVRDVRGVSIEDDSSAALLSACICSAIFRQTESRLVCTQARGPSWVIKLTLVYATRAEYLQYGHITP